MKKFKIKIKTPSIALWFCTFLFSNFSVNNLLYAADKKSYGPSKVTPPDIFTDTSTDSVDEIESLDSASEEDEYPGTNAKPNKKTKTADTPSRSTRAPEDDILINTQREPLPQIRRKHGDVEPRHYPEKRFIEHPNASKGLIKIDKDKNYIYKVKTSDKNYFASLKFGIFEPTELANPDNPNLSFSELYDENNFPLVIYDHDFLFFKKFGELSWKIGGGFYIAQGNGRFSADSVNNGLTPQERFTLLVFPLSVGFTYRLNYLPNQWLIPYAEGGLDGFNFAEVRDDNNNPKIGAKLGFAPAAHFSGGLSIPLGRDTRSFLDLDREYGINAVYISAEFRQYIALSTKFDFSGSAISGGLTADF